jgi:hypothetical protein
MTDAETRQLHRHIAIVIGILALLLGLLLYFSLVEPIPSWVAFYQIAGVVLVGSCVMCYIYLSFRAYEAWWEVLGCLVLVLHVAISLALAYGLAVMTIMFVTDPSKAVCTERLVHQAEFPDYDKTLYFFSYKCVPDGMSLVKVQDGFWPVLETVGLIPDPMDFKVPDLVRKCETLFIQFNDRKASYNLETGAWTLDWPATDCPPPGD